MRLKIGDTDPDKAQVQDETIEALLDEGKSIIRVAIELCEYLAAKWAPAGDVTIDDQMQRASGIYKHYMELAQRLRIEEARSASGTSGSAQASIMVGGLTDTRGPLQDYPASCYNDVPLS